MNARTSRLLRRVAFAVDQVEQRAAAVQGQQTNSSFDLQLAGCKKAWHGTPRPQRAATRRRLVSIFNTIVGGQVNA
jgi:hypothetical protein